MLNVAASKSRHNQNNDDQRKRDAHSNKLAVRAHSSNNVGPQPQTNILALQQNLDRQTHSFSIPKESTQNDGTQSLGLLNTVKPSSATLKLAMMRDDAHESNREDPNAMIGHGLAFHEQAMLRDDNIWLAAYQQHAQFRGEDDSAQTPEEEEDISSIGSIGTDLTSRDQSPVNHKPDEDDMLDREQRISQTLTKSSNKSRHTHHKTPDYPGQGGHLSPSTSETTLKSGNVIKEGLELLFLMVWHFTIYPHWKLYRAWEILVVILVVFNSVMLPYELAFWADIETSEIIESINRISDVLFWLDLVQNFFLAHVDEWGTLHTQKGEIARAYFASWFWVDFIACVPFELFVPGYLVSASDLLKCIRLLRLAKILRFMDRFKFAKVARIFRLFLTVLMLCHWVACIWFRLGVTMLDSGECSLDSIGSSSEDSSPQKAQISPILKLQSCSWLIEHGFADAEIPLHSIYLRSLYWSITTIMTVGYGDIIPVNLREHVFYIFVTIVGAGVYANVFSTIVRIIDRMNAVNNEFAAIMEDMNAQMRYLRFPFELRNKIFSYYDHLFQKQKYMLSGKAPFYRSLSRSIASTCAEHLFFRNVENAAFLQDCSTPFLLEICAALNRMVCVPQQLIIRQGDASDAWFLIDNGECEVLQRPECSGEDSEAQVLRTLGKGDQFGEIGLLTGKYRTATVRATDFCELNYLTVTSFYRLLGRYQQDNKRILHNCVNMLRKAKLNDLPSKQTKAEASSSIWLHSSKTNNHYPFSAEPDLSAAKTELTVASLSDDEQEEENPRFQNSHLLPNSVW